MQLRGPGSKPVNSGNQVAGFFQKGVKTFVKGGRAVQQLGHGVVKLIERVRKFPCFVKKASFYIGKDAAGYQRDGVGKGDILCIGCDLHIFRERFGKIGGSMGSSPAARRNAICAEPSKSSQRR